MLGSDTMAESQAVYPPRPLVSTASKLMNRGIDGRFLSLSIVLAVGLQAHPTAPITTCQSMGSLSTTYFFLFY